MKNGTQKPNFHSEWKRKANCEQKKLDQNNLPNTIGTIPDSELFNIATLNYK